MNKQLLAASLVATLLGLPALSTAASQSAPGAAPAASQHSTSLTEGEVRKVDKEAKKLTIRHGAIANLDMPPMTMVFQVQDAAMLDSIRAGDKIRFQAEKVGGAYTATNVELAK